MNQNFSDVASGINKAMPSKGVIMWGDIIANIPSGWYLCDGNNGTQNLVNRFPVGAGGTYGFGDTGGATTHTHTGTTNNSTTYNQSPLLRKASDEQLLGHVHTFTTDAGSSLPPYLGIAFIMKS